MSGYKSGHTYAIGALNGGKSLNNVLWSDSAIKRLQEVAAEMERRRKEGQRLSSDLKGTLLAAMNPGAQRRYHIVADVVISDQYVEVTITTSLPNGKDAWQVTYKVAEAQFDRFMEVAGDAWRAMDDGLRSPVSHMHAMGYDCGLMADISQDKMYQLLGLRTDYYAFVLGEVHTYKVRAHEQEQCKPIFVRSASRKAPASRRQTFGRNFATHGGAKARR